MGARRLYFDHNASMPIEEDVLERFVEAERLAPGNPDSLHTTGRRAHEMLEAARDDVATVLGLTPDDVVFVSGGTEANNLAVRTSGDLELPVYASAAEHPSSFDAAEPRGRVEWRLDEYGLVEGRGPESEVGLVTLVHGQSEVGTVQDVELAGRIARDLGVPLHVDACQTVGRLALDVVLEVADTVAISPHKFGGLRGGGILVGRGVRRLSPLFGGGGQEGGLRPGTPNPAIAAANALALRHAVTSRVERAAAMQAARDEFERGLDGVVTHVLTPRGDRGLPNTTMCRFDGVDGRSLLPAFDMVGVEASIGSACSSGSPLPPRVLFAMGLDEVAARCCVRFSFSHRTSRDDAREGARRVASVVTRVRAQKN